MTEQKTSFLKFRNKHGQMLVAYKKEGSTFRAGTAFCNPKDFNLPRRERVLKGQRYALGRMEKDNRCVTLSGIPENLLHDITGAQHLELREYIFNCITDMARAVPRGARHYRGESDKCEFRKWFIPFVELECENIEQEMKSTQ